MSSTATSLKGEDFSPYEPLPRRIHGLIHDYPEGLGIFKELIQNADDARATKVRFILDWRERSGNGLKHPSMQSILGPSMLVFNDAIFTSDDFEGLKSLGQGSKRDSIRKTGRFGLGFNSVYNLTDHPSFISGEDICFFDPHRSVFPCLETNSYGQKWLLSEFFEEDPIFMDVFHSGGYESGDSYFEGTLFRLPFRTNQQAATSDICSTPFTRQENAEPLLEKLVEMGEELLLFLKSVEEIDVIEIEPDGTRKTRLCVKTQNASVVTAAKQKLLAVFNEAATPQLFVTLCQKYPDRLTEVSYLHRIQTVMPDGIQNSTWRVVNLMRLDSESEMLAAMSKLNAINEKAVPWAGAAARVKTDCSSPVTGKQYCFLPLPKLTGLPIHIHGYFDLNSSRQGSTNSDNTGNAAVRSQWNALLVKHVVVPACVLLVESLVEDIGEGDPAAFYNLWPVDSSKLDVPLGNIATQFIEAIQSKAILRSNLLATDQKNRWVRPNMLSVLPYQAIALNVFEPLTADSICLPDPMLPSCLVEAFAAAQHPLEVLIPAQLRSYLQKINISQSVPIEAAPKPSLRNWEWVRSLLEYCLSDGYTDLRALPLAILANGHLQCFGGGELGWVYLADSLQREIFAEQPQWFLDAALQSALPKLSEHMRGVSELTPESVAERLSLLDLWEEELPQQWNPDGETLPNAPWISLIYKYFAKVNRLPAAFSSLPIVPDCDGYLHAGGETSTPLWTKVQISPELQAALDYFDISLVSTEHVDRLIFERFFHKHPISEPDSDIDGNGLIFALTGCDLIDTLHEWREDLPEYDVTHHKTLLVYLETEASNLTDSAKRKLSTTPIFPTRCGTNTALDIENVYLPEAQLPNLSLNLVLLRTDDSWRNLLQVTLPFTEVKKLSLERLIVECVLPSFSSWDPSAQLTALVWIRLNLPLAVESLRRTGDYKALQKAVGRAPLLRCTDGQIRAAQETYRPGEKQVTDVLGQTVAFPDMVGAYADGSDLWLSFFDDIGILRKPSPQDLVDRARSLQKKCAVEEDMDSISDASIRLLFYVEEHWEELCFVKVRVSGATVDLPTALRDTAWLPAERNPHELERWPGALDLPQRNCLYRPNEILFVQEVNLAASQRRYLRLQTQPRAEVAAALGFKRPLLSEVVQHFGYLLEKSKEDRQLVRSREFSSAINRVYTYLEDAFTRGEINTVERSKFKQRYSQTECLWDGTGRFWRPEHVFESHVPYFAHRRLGRENGKFIGLYRLLGQKSYPRFQDYLDFIAEVQYEYDDQPIRDSNDVDCVIAVLQRMASILEKTSDVSLQPNFLLTEDLFLLPARTVIIPDAPWYEEPVRNANIAKLLHPKVSRILCDHADSPSLLRDISARPAKDGLFLSSLPDAKEQALVWQTHMQSIPFSKGLERLLRDSNLEATNVEWEKFASVEVTSADKVLKDLYWGSRKVASSVSGDAYFDKKQNTFYIRYDESVGINYLADCLNQQLATVDCSLLDKSKLIRIIEADPASISRLLDSLRVRSVQSLILPVIKEPLPTADDAKANSGITALENTPTSQDLTKTACFVKENSFSRVSKSKSQDLLKLNGLLTEEQLTTVSHARKTGEKAPEIMSVRRSKSQNLDRSQGGYSKRTLNKRNDKWKTVVYPTHDLHTECDAEQLTRDARTNVELAGVRQVLKYERQRGRKPEEMPTNNPGYDIESINLDGSTRYIEVKSFRWCWSASGAKLSKTQFEMAQKKGNNYWLYVVELAEDFKKFKIHRIQDPANRVKDFYFDDGWKQISVADNEYADLLQI